MKKYKIIEITINSLWALSFGSLAIWCINLITPIVCGVHQASPPLDPEGDVFKYVFVYGLMGSLLGGAAAEGLSEVFDPED